MDTALVAHVAYVRDGAPVVLPFACARDGDWLLLHGSTGAGLLRACAAGQPISAAITHLDGLVVARSTFDNSMNYRSAVVFGVPEVLAGAEQERALDILVDHLLPGRSAEVRRSSRKELAATSVLRVRLDQVSVKVRTGGPSVAPDDGEDRTVWAGVHSARHGRGTAGSASRRRRSAGAGFGPPSRPPLRHLNRRAGGSDPVGRGCPPGADGWGSGGSRPAPDPAWVSKKLPAARSPVRSIDQPMQAVYDEEERQAEAVEVLPAVPLLVPQQSGVLPEFGLPRAARWSGRCRW